MAGILLVAHGLVHLLYLVDDVTEFQIEDSWVVPEAVTRWVAMTLMGATIVASVLLGMAVWGVPGLASLWPALAIAAATTSMALLFAFWDNHLVFGVTINIALVLVAVMQPEWTTQLLS